jgi:hypothetical protein
MEQEEGERRQRAVVREQWWLLWKRGGARDVRGLAWCVLFPGIEWRD